MALVRESSGKRYFGERLVCANQQFASPIEALAQHIAVRWNARGLFEGASEMMQR
jgi:hypothetical protein